MKILLNGRPREVAAGSSLTQLVRLLELDRHPIAVELNTEVVSRSRFPETILKEKDCVEIVHFVGGG